MSSLTIVYLLHFRINVASNEQIKPLPSSLNKLTHHFERSRCVSLNDRSVGCGDVVKCVHCIQWTSVSHRATAAEMTHVCLSVTSYHFRGISRCLQIQTQKHVNYVSKDIQYPSPRHKNPSMLSVGNSNILILSAYESKTKPTMLKDVFL